MAGESPSLVSGRLWNLLCRTLSKGNATWTKFELLGVVGRIQVLGSKANGLQLFGNYINRLLGFTEEWGWTSAWF